MPTLEHDVTRSSMFSKITYNEESKTLILTFAKGGSYQYSDVPKIIYNDLIASDSMGKYFLANIKDKFETERL